MFEEDNGIEWYNKAFALENLGRHEESKRCYEKAKISELQID